MKILHISKYYFPYTGGVENICKYIVDNSQNHQVAVLCFNGGISDAFNKGIKVATGELIVMINSDDMLTSDALTKFYKSYVPGYDVYCGDVILWNPKTDYKALGEGLTNYKRIPFHYRPWHQGCYITKRAYEEYGTYSTEYKQLMDLDLMLRFTRAGAKFYHIKDTLAIFRLGGISQKG